MHRIETGVLDIIHFIGEAAVGNQNVIPFTGEEPHNVGDERNPIVRTLCSDGIGANLLQKRPSFLIFLSVPTEECFADVFHQVPIVGDQNRTVVRFQSAFEKPCCGVFAVSCFAGNQNYFHFLPPFCFLEYLRKLRTACRTVIGSSGGRHFISPP